MDDADATSWTMIHGAAKGDPVTREAFARCYAPVVRAYLQARWRGSSLLAGLEDAIQDVFVDCYREGGILERADSTRRGGFRAFFYGVIRTVALKVETRRNRSREHQPPSQFDLDQIQGDEARLSQVLDRAWGQMVLRDALNRQAARASAGGERAVKRVELLRMRVYDGLPIRAIAQQWQVDVAVLRREYASARKEFKTALKEALAFHNPASLSITDDDLADLVRVVSIR